MRYRVLGGTGMQVSVVGLGTMLFGSDDTNDVRLIRCALDEGVTLLDTADVYMAGASERMVGKALAGRRDEVILATKGHHPVDHGTLATHPPPNSRGNSRRHIIRACEASLRRLNTDWIDLYQVHQPDADTDVEETLSALTDLTTQGKIRAFGSSNFPADLIVEAQWAAERRGLARIRSEQFPYSIFVRRAERDVLPACRRHAMGALAFSPLDGGWLSGTYRAGMTPRAEGQARTIPRRFDAAYPHVRRKFELIEALIELAADAGVPISELATAWTLHHPAVTASIVGPRSGPHLSSAVRAGDLQIADDLLDRIDELVPPGSAVHPEESLWPSPDLRRSARRRPGRSG
jgi:aryl-alcohol dehydrogenase-like predicted oxidoreductase